MDLAQNILEIIENDPKIDISEIAALTGRSDEEIRDCVCQLEGDGTIRKYKTIIDWDKVDNGFVYAIIEIKVSLERETGYNVVADRISKFPEVRSVRLISGDHDISLTIRGKSMKQVAFFVAEKIATLPQVQSTATHFVLKTYKEDGVILYETEHTERLPIVA
uniref:Putative HTH-type transcriptional regulator n=1 Tax=Candidatus Methanogaster sp. ANME-2c ERB4 TaxID=2759911 RepID=A0A7G9YQJ7_9EURY|nr:putative HTH-type transcriptional regulator [Methanosarcinales archaeon ANME-2c ERB4]QNO50281.1 putative HTH-type transcriptional regulator [Methanosarcinales archaeon ANME-2c ERB4]